MLPGAPLGQALALPDIGHALGGKYEIVRLLGEGGMAFVFEAQHKRLHQRVAIKLLAPELATDAELVQRFEREARAVARLSTKHVVRVTDVDVTGSGLPYMVMEFLEGRDLDAELQARRQLPVAESVDIVVQACSGMLEAHAMGIIHRDLKPANLFLARERDGAAAARVVKILDFGISKMLGESSRLTGAGAVMGTVLYMSPEQVRAEPNLDVRADVWSLGVILFELLAGRPPFEGSSPQIAVKIVSTDAPDLRTFAPNVPEGLALTVRRMLDRDRERRFATLLEVVEALAPFTAPGSLGAAIAGTLHAGRSGSRGKTALLSSKRTLPMANAPASARSLVPNARITGPQAPAATALLPAPPLEAPEPQARSRALLVIAIMLGLLAAAGAVLAIVALARRQAAPPPVPSATASVVPEPPAVTTSAAPVALPPAPATGTVRPPAPTATSTGKKDGGASRSAPTSSAGDNPSHI
jgi:eukaryotic-like serine/threonine-protein kinase